MAEEPDVIREQIDETRSALTHKLETLEDQVRETVQSAKETVEDTIENVKSSVEETVAAVRRTFDLSYQVDRHPWGMLTGSLLSGCMLGYWIEGRRQEAQRQAREAFYAGLHAAARPAAVTVTEHATLARPNGSPSVASFAQPAPAEPARPGLLSRLGSQFEGEIDKVKEVAIGVLMGVVRDLAKQSLPQLAPQIDEVLNSATSKLGGEPVRGPLLEPTGSGGTGATTTCRSL